MSLHGIESEDDCRAAIDELLRSHARAEGSMNKDRIATLKGRLQEFYKKGDTNEGKRLMSKAENQYFWPAIQEAYVKAPKINSPRTWRDGLYEISLNLRFYIPKQG
jgi:hypothetical protein